MDYSAAYARDYTKISPKMGQVFFIGDGIMDSFEWNDNSGHLSGGIFVEK